MKKELIYQGAGGKPDSVTKTEDTLYSQDIVEMVISFGEGAVEGLHDGFHSFLLGDEPLVQSVVSGTVPYNFPDFCLSMRQGYEDDLPIDFLLGGETSLVRGSATLAPQVEEITTIPSSMANPVRFLDLRLMVQSLYAGNQDGSVYTASIELEISYRPESSGVWQYVTSSFLMQLYRGVHLQTALKRMTVSERQAFELMDEAAKNEIIRKKLLVVADADPAVTEGLNGKSAPNAYLEKDIVTTTLENTFVASGSATNPNAYVITGKTTSGYVHEISIPVPQIAEAWILRVVRKTPAVTDQYSSKEIAIDSVSAIGRSVVSYPRVALAHIVAQHTDRFDSIPDFSCIMDGILCDVPVNYNPKTRVYDGVWLGNWKKAWTNNPVWILRELIMNPDWGDRSREPSIGINSSSFYEAAQFCDQPIPTFNPNDGASYIPRHTLNMILQDYKSSDEVKKFIAGSFRAVLSEKNGQYSLHLDRERLPTFFVCPELISVEGFQYSTTDLSSRYNYMKVRYQDAGTLYREDTRLITDPASINLNGIISTDITAVGCTNLDEAIRLAAFSLLTNKNETTLVSFKLPRLPLYIEQYENFLIADRTCGWGDSGRISKVTSNVITLRNPILGTVGALYTLYYFSPVLGLSFITVQKLDNFSYQIVSEISSTEDLLIDGCVALSGNDIGSPKLFRALMAKDEGNGNAHMYTLEASEVYQDKYTLVDNLTPNTAGLSFTTTKMELKDRYNVPSPLTVTVGLGDLTNTLSGINYEIDISVDHVLGNVYEVRWYAEGTRPADGYVQVLEGSPDGVRGLLSPAYPLRSTLINFEITVVDPNGNRGATYYLLNQNPKPIQTIIEEVKLSDRMIYDFEDGDFVVAWLNPEDMDIFQYHRLEMFRQYDSMSGVYSDEIITPIPLYDQETQQLLRIGYEYNNLRTADGVNIFVNLYYRRYYQARESMVALQINKFLQSNPSAPSFNANLDFYGNEVGFLQYDAAYISLNPNTPSGRPPYAWTDSLVATYTDLPSAVAVFSDYYNPHNYHRPVQRYIHLVVSTQPFNHTNFSGMIIMVRKVGNLEFIAATPLITSLSDLNQKVDTPNGPIYYKGIIIGEGAGDYEYYFYYVGKATGANSRMPDVRTKIRTFTLF